MYIQKNNILFTRLNEEDIELLRHWRNHNSIKKYMVYREHITEEMQKKWFQSVNNNKNLYFIIEYKGKKIGLINGKDIDWDGKTMETGIFIWNKYYRKTHIPTICTMIFAEFGVAMGGLTPTATILRNNERALKYNKMLGFKIIEDDPEKEYIRLSLEKDNMGYIAKRLKAALNLLAGDELIKMHFDKEDVDGGIHDLIIQGIGASNIKNKESDGDSITYYF